MKSAMVPFDIEKYISLSFRSFCFFFRAVKFLFHFDMLIGSVFFLSFYLFRVLLLLLLSVHSNCFACLVRYMLHFGCWYLSFLIVFYAHIYAKHIIRGLFSIFCMIKVLFICLPQYVCAHYPHISLFSRSIIFIIIWLIFLYFSPFRFGFDLFFLDAFFSFRFFSFCFV